MVARLVRDQEVVGSSPVTSTTKKRRVFCPSLFCFCGREPTTSSLLQGSRKSQRSEIFGKRRSGARTRAPTRRGGARKQPTATTRVQVPSPRPRKSEGFFALRFFVFADANPRPLFIIFHCYIYVRRIPQALPPADLSLRNRDLYLIIPLQYAGKHDQLQRKPGLGAVIAFCSIRQLREYPSALLFGTVGA